MSISLRGATVTNANTAAPSPAIPAAAVVGDLMVLGVASGSNATATGTPSGWTTIVNWGGLYLGYKVHASGDAAPTVTFPSAQWTTANLAVMAGVDTTTPVDSSAFVINQTTYSPCVAPPIVPSRANSFALQIFATTSKSGAGNPGWTTPSPSSGTLTTVSSSSTNGPGVMMYGQQESTQAATPTTTLSGTNLTANLLGASLILNTAGDPNLGAPYLIPYLPFSNQFGASSAASSLSLAMATVQPFAQVGDLALVTCQGTSSITWTPPAGWAAVSGTAGGGGAVFSKVLASADLTGTFVFTASASSACLGACSIARAPIGSPTVDTAGRNGGTTGPALTPASGYELLVSSVCGANTATSPSITGTGAETVLRNASGGTGGAIALAYTCTPTSSSSAGVTGSSGTTNVMAVLLAGANATNVGLSGAHATAKAGALTVSTSSTVGLTGRHAAAATHMPVSSQALLRALTGHPTSGKSGALTATTGKTAALTGQHGAAKVGSVATAQALARTVTGQHGAAKGGTLTPAQALTKALAGTHAAAHAGMLAPSTSKSVILSGQHAAAKNGLVAAGGSVTRAITGTLIRAAAHAPGLSRAASLENAQAAAMARAPTRIASRSLVGNAASATSGAVKSASALTRMLTRQHAAARAGTPATNGNITRGLPGARAAARARGVVAMRMVAASGARAGAYSGLVHWPHYLVGQRASAQSHAPATELTLMLAGYRVTARGGIFALGDIFAGQAALTITGPALATVVALSDTALARTASPQQLVAQETTENAIATTASATMLAILQPNNIFTRTD